MSAPKGYIATERGPYERDYGHAIGDFVAQDCRNVWDYETSEPIMSRSLDAFECAVEQWTEAMAAG